jgi:hypothetical protein
MPAHRAGGACMSVGPLIEIAPGVIFSTAVFTPVHLSQRKNLQGSGARHHPGVDARQLVLWADDADHAPRVDKGEPMRQSTMDRPDAHTMSRNGSAR